MKLTAQDKLPITLGRSREGAWIEIKRANTYDGDDGGRSREGAWIEILKKKSLVQTADKSLP